MTPDTPPIRSILFVCLGNICRSPAGENVMRHLLQRAGLDTLIQCDSAGITGYHCGAPPDARMRTAAQQRNLPMLGSARQVMREDLDNFDLILAMDRSNYAGLMKLATDANRHKVQLFCEYCRHHPDSEVPDPYHGDAADFDYVLDLMEDGCSHLLNNLLRLMAPI